MENKIHIYFMPGLAASPKIFEHIKLDEQKFVLHYLDWLEPLNEKESLNDYASRYVDEIKQNSPVLIGVSFGGVLVQEIARIIQVRKLIIISSIKSEAELPKRLKYIRKTGVYKLFPSSKMSKIDDFSKFNYHPNLKKKGELYNKYLGLRNEKYLNWAIRNMLYWKSLEKPNELIHIHGTKDEIFPIKHIKNCIPIEGGTHAMIIIKAKRISTIIENVLTDDT